MTSMSWGTDIVPLKKMLFGVASKSKIQDYTNLGGPILT